MSIFTQVSRPKVKRSTHNISEEMKLSCNFGQLIPILCKEVLPSDKFKVSTELMIKLAPLKAPLMHRMKAYVDYFFVPIDQLNTTFEKFINAKVNTAANPVTKAFWTPSSVDGVVENGIGSLMDYLGLPVTQTSWLQNSSLPLDPLPLMAYQHIYNCFYRDQNMEVMENADPDTTSLFLTETYKDLSGDITQILGDNQLANLFKLRNCAWKHDYFTSALPSPQAGDSVMMPVTGDVQILSNGALKVSGTDGDVGDANQVLRVLGDGEPEEGEDTSATLVLGDGQESEPNPLKYFGGLKTNSSFQGISINNLRKLFSLQSFKELIERGGSRYPEVVQNFFNAFLPDIYYNRPKYLGGQVQDIKVSEVVQTSQTTEGDSGSPQGYRAGIAGSYGYTTQRTLKANRHGFLIGLLRVMPEATYSQGVERMWTRNSLYDYAWPQFEKIGEQEIYSRELYVDGSDQDDTIFGYTPRYAEYKEGHCHIAGEFRTSLDYWHMGRKFANRPVLSKEFIMMNNVSYDPFYVTTDEQEHIYVDLYNTIISKRPLSYFGTPSKL